MSPAHSLRHRDVEWQDSIAAFLHRYGPIFSFDDHERALLECSAAHSQLHEPGTYIRRQTDIDTRPCIVASGWACYARSHNGRRQIFSFILPGDSIGLTGGPFARRGSEIVALTANLLVDASNLKHALADSECPNLRMALDLEQGLHEARLLDQVVLLGQKSSLERTACLLLELHYRLDRAGLVKNGIFQLPLTQIQMGEALGLSQIQMHRSLSSLRRNGLLVLNGRYGRGAALPNLALLERAGGYEIR